MNWSNPNPEEVKYWQAISLAITERVSLIRQVGMGYDFEFRGINLNKVTVDSPKSKQIINTFSTAIFNLIPYFAEVTERKDSYGLIYINALKPELILSECGFFYIEPQTTAENEKLKDFLVACKKVLDRLYLVQGNYGGNLGLYYKSKATFDTIEKKENLSDILNFLDTPENLKSEYTESKLEYFSLEIEYSKYYQSFFAYSQTIPQKIYFKNPTCFPCEFYVYPTKDGYENWKQGYSDFGLNWQEDNWNKIVNASEKTGEKLIAENLNFNGAFAESDFDTKYGGDVEKGFNIVCYADFSVGLQFIEK